MSEQGGNPFTSLASGLAEFAARLEADPGDKVAALDGESGFLPDAIRSLFAGLKSGLEEIDGLAGSLETLLVQIDAAVAAAEVMLAIASGATELGFGDMAEAFGISREPIDKVNAALSLGVSKVDLALQITQLLPTADEVRAIRTLIADLVQLHPEGEPEQRSLADLLQALGVGSDSTG